MKIVYASRVVHSSVMNVIINRLVKNLICTLGHCTESSKLFLCLKRLRYTQQILNQLVYIPHLKLFCVYQEESWSVREI